MIRKINYRPIKFTHMTGFSEEKLFSVLYDNRLQNSIRIIVLFKGRPNYINIFCDACVSGVLDVPLVIINSCLPKDRRFILGVVKKSRLLLKKVVGEVERVR